MCEGINCGIGGNCKGGNCTCQTGYTNVENFCQDMCSGINCGSGGDCLDGNCTCQIGFTSVKNFCEETCALTPCQELIKISQKTGIYILTVALLFESMPEIFSVSLHVPYNSDMNRIRTQNVTCMCS